MAMLLCYAITNFFARQKMRTTTPFENNVNFMENLFGYLSQICLCLAKPHIHYGRKGRKWAGVLIIQHQNNNTQV